VERVYGPPLAQVGYRNSGLQSRVETTFGYNPLELAAYADYASAAETNTRLIDGFAASDVLTSDQGNLRPNPTALPLAYFARSVTSTADVATLDPHVTTLVDGAAPDVRFDPDATVDVVARDEGSMTLRYASTTSNVVRIAVPLYPGWSASLNGADLPLFRVDGAFIGVVAPPGQGDIQLTYSSRFFVQGAAMSGLGLVLGLGLMMAPHALAGARGIAGSGAGRRHLRGHVPDRRQRIARVWR
jgi:hypothetical protein